MAAELTQSIFDIAGAYSQIFAMLMGAFLASAGGFMVTVLLDRLERHREERSIALVCLDLLTSMQVVAKLAERSRGRGDPYGPVTLRLIRRMLRDVDVYERNRERIADIRDADLRAEVYAYMARTTMAIEGVIYETDTISTLDERIQFLRFDGHDAKADELGLKKSESEQRRTGSFDFLIEEIADSPALVARLRAVAGSDGHRLSEIVDRQTAAGARAQAGPSAEN